MVIVTKFHQNRSNGSWDMLCWQKEEEEEEERKNARETGHIRLQRMCKKKERRRRRLLRAFVGETQRRNVSYSPESIGI